MIFNDEKTRKAIYNKVKARDIEHHLDTGVALDFASWLNIPKIIEYMKLFNGVVFDDGFSYEPCQGNCIESSIPFMEISVGSDAQSITFHISKSLVKDIKIDGYVTTPDAVYSTNGEVVTVVISNDPSAVKVLLIGIEPDKKISSIATILTYSVFDYAKEIFPDKNHSYIVDCLNAQERIKELTKRGIKPIDEQYLDLTTGLSVEQYGMIQNADSPIAAAMYLESFISKELDKEKTF